MSDAFPWGQVIETRKLEIDHEERLEVVKYHPWKCEGVSVQTGVPDTDVVQYHVQEMRRSFGSMHEAMIGWIAQKRLGPNHDVLAQGVCRALGVSCDARA